jgi:hypothetical protein
VAILATAGLIASSWQQHSQTAANILNFVDFL